MKRKTVFAPLALLMGLTTLTGPVLASPVTYPGSPATDTAGVAVTSGVTATVSSVTDLDGVAKAASLAAAHVAGGNVSAVYDAATGGEAWVTLTLTAPGHTFAPAVIFCSSDPSTLLATSASSQANGTALASNGTALGLLPGLLLVTPANRLATTPAGAVSLAPAEHALIGSQDVPAGLTAQGLTSALVTSLAAQIARIYGAEWGSVTPGAGGGYSVAMPGGALTVPAPGAAVGTVAPAYDASGRPTTITKTVN